MHRDDSSLIASGHYARKQIFSRNRLVAWSHGSRFETARRLVAPHAGARLLDYGCGDGTFLALVHDLFPDAVGVDADASQIAGCVQRFASLAGMTFATTQAIGGAEYDSRYGIIVCMSSFTISGWLDRYRPVSCAFCALSSVSRFLASTTPGLALMMGKASASSDAGLTRLI